MIRRLALSLLVLALLAATTPMALTAQDVDRDRLAPLVMDAPAYAAFPPRFLNEENTDIVTRIVFEARSFGVPFAIRVITVPTAPDLLGTGAEVPAQVTQRLADQWLATETIESSEGAADGILLLVVVPRDDRTGATAAFATGPNALPQNGLTRARLDGIVRDVMRPLFAENRISDGIIEGAATVSYQNLFLPSPRQELGESRQRLQEIVNGPMAAVTALAGLAAVGAALWVRMRSGAAPGDAVGGLTPFEAGALARGRVDDAVTAGALLWLIETGALVVRRAGRGTALALGEVPSGSDPFVSFVWQIVQREATAEGAHIPPAVMRWLPRLLDPARAWLEDDLARRGLFDRTAHIRTARLLLAGGLALAVAFYALVPSILGMARWGIFAIVVTILGSIIVAWWAARRPWTTPAGQQALRDWLARHPEPTSPERAIYDAIARQEILLGIDGGSFARARPVRLVRALRGLGAA